MKRGALIALAAVLAVPAGVLIFGGESAGRQSGAEPIDYEHETCARCHMRFATPGFAGERRGRDGRLTKFDDIRCLLQAVAGAHEETTDVWVEDHEGGGWVPLASATFVRGKRLQTPMGSGIVAFKSPAAAERLARGAIAQVIPLEDLLRDRSLLESEARP